MRRNQDSMTRFIGSAVKLHAPDAVVDTFGGEGTVTLANGQVFRYAVEELDQAEAAER